MLVQICEIACAGSPKSLSDDDLCSGCSNCQEAAFGMSVCKVNFPGRFDSDGYVQQCDAFLSLSE